MLKNNSMNETGEITTKGGLNKLILSRGRLGLCDVDNSSRVAKPYRNPEHKETDFSTVHLVLMVYQLEFFYIKKKIYSCQRDCLDLIQHRNI